MASALEKTKKTRCGVFVEVVTTSHKQCLYRFHIRTAIVSFTGAQINHICIKYSGDATKCGRTLSSTTTHIFHVTYGLLHITILAYIHIK